MLQRIVPPSVAANGISCNPITISDDSVVAAMNELNLDLQDTIASYFHPILTQ